MTTLEKKIDICLRWIINDDPNELAAIKSEAYSALNDCACHSKNDIHSAVVSLLKELGISQHLTGFNQLVCAIELVIEDEGYMRNIFNGLYPAVAERTGSNAHRAERNMRHAIENGMDKGNVDIWNIVFGNSIHPNKGRPSNSEFFAACAYYIKKDFVD